ncbi:hypothetical protein F2P56_030077, partial [Juglans regia]
DQAGGGAVSLGYIYQPVPWCMFVLRKEQGIILRLQSITYLSPFFSFSLYLVRCKNFDCEASRVTLDLSAGPTVIGSPNSSHSFIQFRLLIIVVAQGEENKKTKKKSSEIFYFPFLLFLF